MILVRSPVGVGVRPRVKGWACLAQNTDCTSSTNLGTRTPSGGCRGNTFDRGRGDASKLPLNSRAVGRDVRGRTRGRVKRGGSGSLVKVTWLKQRQASLSPSRSASTFATCARSLPLGRKTQSTKETPRLIKGRHLKGPLPRSNLGFTVV